MRSTADRAQVILALTYWEAPEAVPPALYGCSQADWRQLVRKMPLHQRLNPAE